jgi:hypothetical protein
MAPLHLQRNHGILPETFNPRTPHPYLHLCYNGQVLIPRRGYGTTLHQVAIPWPLHLQINGAWLKAPCRPMRVPFHARDPPDLPRPEGRPGSQSQLLPRPSTSSCPCSCGLSPPELVPTAAEDASLGKLPSDLPWRLGLVTISRNAAVPVGPGGRESRHVSPCTYRPGIQHGNIYITVPRRRRAPFRPRELPFRHVHSVLDCTLSRPL